MGSTKKSWVVIENTESNCFPNRRVTEEVFVFPPLSLYLPLSLCVYLPLSVLSTSLSLCLPLCLSVSIYLSLFYLPLSLSVYLSLFLTE
jgi:hypothetical protein